MLQYFTSAVHFTFSKLPTNLQNTVGLEKVAEKVTNMKILFVSSAYWKSSLTVQSYAHHITSVSNKFMPASWRRNFCSPTEYYPILMSLRQRCWNLQYGPNNIKIEQNANYGRTLQKLILHHYTSCVFVLLWVSGHNHAESILMPGSAGFLWHLDTSPPVCSGCCVSRSLPQHFFLMASSELGNINFVAVIPTSHDINLAARDNVFGVVRYLRNFRLAQMGYTSANAKRLQRWPHGTTTCLTLCIFHIVWLSRS